LEIRATRGSDDPFEAVEARLRDCRGDQLVDEERRSADVPGTGQLHEDPFAG
jgi:hypothetical protein